MTKSKHWPQKADFKELHRDDAVVLLKEFSSIHEMECMSDPFNFDYLAFKDPIHCDMMDIWIALRFVIDVVNASQDDERMVELGKRLRRRLGALDQRIALTLVGRYRHNYIIEPQLWLQEIHRVELSQADFVCIFYAYGKKRRVESLHEVKALRNLSFMDPAAFTPHEQAQALTYIINAVNAARSDAGMTKLGQFLARRFGMLTKSISLSLQGYKTVIQPGVCMQR